MKIIELFGVPGVGKTTTLREVLKIAHSGIITKDQLKTNAGPRIFANLLKTDNRWLFFNRHINKSLSIAKSPALSIYSRHIERTMWRFVGLEAYRDKRLLFMDGGLCQRGLSLALCDIDTSSYLLQYYELMPLPFAVINFENSLEVIKKRNNSRTVSKEVTWNFASKVVYLNSIYEMGKIILKRRGLHMLTIHTHLPEKQNAQTIINFLDDLPK